MSAFLASRFRITGSKLRKKVSLVVSESTDRRIEESCEYPRIVGIWFVRKVLPEIEVDVRVVLVG